MKKILMLLVTLTALCAVGCKEPATPPEVVAIRTNKGEFINGFTDVNPKEVEYIEITFDKPMDRRYWDFINYNNAYEDFTGFSWENSFTYRIELCLSYNYNFLIIINDHSYNSETYTPKKSYWRDENGTYAPQIKIEFSTIPYPTSDRDPREFVIDFTNPETYKVIKNNNVIKLAPNEYDVSGNKTSKPDNQQCVFSLKNFLNRENLIEGDKLTIKYKIQSSSDLSKIKANLIDNSYEADPKDSWFELSTDKDLVIAPDYTPTSVYEGELTFNITESMKRLASIQLYALYEDLKENASIAFVLD